MCIYSGVSPAWTGAVDTTSEFDILVNGQLLSSHCFLGVLCPKTITTYINTHMRVGERKGFKHRGNGQTS